MFAITHVPSPRMAECELTHVSRQAIDYGLALNQHEKYRQMLARGGAQVRVLDANLSMPDCVFVEDTAIVLDEVAIMCSMGAESRRGEPKAIEPELARHREIRRIELPATIDGGDVLRVGRLLLVGRSQRTDAAGIAALESIARPLGYHVIPITLRDCLHLKSAVCALPDGRLFVNPNWLDAGPLETDCNLVAIPPEEPFAADVLLLGQTVCVAAAHPRSAEMIHRLGFGVQTIDLSEFAKAEGGVTCLSILVAEVG